MSVDHLAHRLANDGFVVVPNVVPAAALAATRASILSARATVDYMVPGRPAEVAGAFGALADPHSIWHPTYIACRAQIGESVRPVFDAAIAILIAEGALTPSPHWRRTDLIDRVGIRPAGTSTNGENWHSDVASDPSLPRAGNLVIAGGFTNYTDRDLVFRCAPGTHKDPADGTVRDVRTFAATGFARVTSPEEIAALNAIAVDVVIPPAAHIVFFQHLRHAIATNKSATGAKARHLAAVAAAAATGAAPPPPYSAKRRREPPAGSAEAAAAAEEAAFLWPPQRVVIYHGFFACSDPAFTEYPFGGDAVLARLAADQATPRLPSGQQMPVYAGMHTAFTNKPFGLLEHDPPAVKTPLRGQLSRIFTEGYLTAYGRGAAGLPPRFMPSLRDMEARGVARMLPPVAPEALAIYRPTLIEQ